MAITRTIISSFKSAHNMEYGAKFYKADLHYHTPASEDARGENRYDFNPYKTKYPRREESQNYLRAVKAIQENILEDSRNVAANIVQRFLEVDLSLVAVTDHNGIGTIWADNESQRGLMDLAAPTWYELIDDEARKINEKAGNTVLTILPGTEISTTGIHILAIFPPQRPRRKVHFMICDLLNEVGFAIDDWGKNPKVGTVSVFDTINLIIKKGGIPIPAHIDGSDQAMLKLYRITSGAMRNVLQHHQLSAVEIVKPARFTRKDRGLKRPLKDWIDSLRRKEGLPPFAYFQGSDAHDIPSIAKRHTYIKMTEPSFSGLKTAIKMPSSRVRISDLHRPEVEGLYIHSVEIKSTLLGKRFLRFNRHLNCITGKKGAGKSHIYHLMQSAVNPDFPKVKGYIRLFVEKVIDSTSHYYAFFRDEQHNSPKLYAINQDTQSAREIDAEKSGDLGIRPKFYNTEKIEDLISSKAKFNDFLVRHFGKPTKAHIHHFNEIFSMSNFLQKENEQLLSTKNKQDRYELYLNVGWHAGKEKMRNFFTLSYSLRRTAIMSIIIIMNDFGPAIIDAPEMNFDNEDIMNFLVPLIKKIKDFRQVILFTNNPILAVNTDPDNYILLHTEGQKLKNITSGFAIDEKSRRPLLLNIMEGSLKSFRKRAVRYDSVE